MSEVTRILNSIEGNPKASEALLPMVYEELRRLAAAKMAHERPGHTLQPTALVHEAWLRLTDEDQRLWDSRGHFFAAAAEAMRRILIEVARRKKRHRHGGGQPAWNLRQEEFSVEAKNDQLLAVHEALSKLEETNAVAANVVKLRYFVGLDMAEAATALEVPLRTAERLWSYARAWLRREIHREQP